MSRSSWRDKASPVIAEILARPSLTIFEQNAELSKAYPFGERKYHPYKIWLDEIRRQRGGRTEVGKRAEHEKLQEWESLYGRRQA
jgi:hypothetical protein